MCAVQHRLVGYLIKGIWKGGPQGSAIMKELAQQAQEQLKAFPVA